MGIHKLADYCASKFGAVGFAESLMAELHVLGKDGVKSTLVCPYFISTGMFDGTMGLALMAGVAEESGVAGKVGIAGIAGVAEELGVAGNVGVGRETGMAKEA